MDLRGAYNLSANQGYLAPQHYASLAEKMGVPVPSVKQWFNEERMAKGHAGNYHKYPKRKGKPPSVEVRTNVPLSRGKAPSATYVPEAKGEYFEDDIPQKVKMDVLWPPTLKSITMYSFDLEAQGLIDGTHSGTRPPLDDA